VGWRNGSGRGPPWRCTVKPGVGGGEARGGVGVGRRRR
jgi:hypothetical protein